MTENSLVRIEPFLVRADSRADAVDRARRAIAGAQIRIAWLDTEDALIEYADYLKQAKHQ